jgi:hypothetical protein
MLLATLQMHGFNVSPETISTSRNICEEREQQILLYQLNQRNSLRDFSEQVRVCWGVIQGNMLTIPMKHPASSVDNGVVSSSMSVPPPVPARGTPAKFNRHTPRWAEKRIWKHRLVSLG